MAPVPAAQATTLVPVIRVTIPPRSVSAYSTVV
jgi:hypothetical protein